MESISNEDNYEVIDNLATKLRTYCNNGDISSAALRTFIKDNIPTKHLQDVLRESSMLCDSISVKNCEEYPLHVACMNKDCPSDVITFLAEKYTAAIRHSSIDDEAKFPVHIYLGSGHYDLEKKSPGRKIDMELVLMLIKEYPGAFTEEDDTLFYDFELAEMLADYLNQYCNEDGMSITGLRERIEQQIPQMFIQDVLREAYMLCDSKNVSLEIIKCLLEYYPEGASAEIRTYHDWGTDKAYPLHFACKNEHCPSDVIEFLMKQCPKAIRYLSIIEGGVEVPDSITIYEEDYEVSGLPLHYYVSRPSSKINKEIVIKLVNGYPESITKACESTDVKPIDLLLITKGVFGFYGLARYCETKVVTIEKIRERISSIPREQFFIGACYLPEHLNLLQKVCSNENLTLEVVEYLLAEYDPDAAGREIDAGYTFEQLSAYPLHWACMNSSCPDSVIQLLITRYPNALRKLTVIDGGIDVDHPVSREYDQEDNAIAGLPLHYYLARAENIELETVKMMVKQYPESLTTTGQENTIYYSALFAPLDVLLMNRPHIMNSFEVVQLLIESNRHSIHQGGSGYSSLQYACSSFEMDPRIIKLIINTCPDLISRTDHMGDTAVHTLCKNRSLPDNVVVEMLQLLIEKDPSSLKIMNGHRERMLPIHVAALEGRSKHICKALYDADKESIRARSSQNRLPLHIAARPFSVAERSDHLDTLKGLFNLDPSTLGIRGSGGKLFFRDGADRRSTVQLFLEAQWSYYLDAQKTKSLTKRDEVGQVTLHRALCSDNISLGSIKVLLEASPDTLFIADNDGTLPFHVACGFSSSDIVEYLTEHFTVSSFGSSIKDVWGNTPLHYACRYGKLDTVKLLLEKQEYIDSISVRNDDGKLPIQLLCEAPRLGLRKKIDRESTEYTETIWLLLSRCPETVVNW